MTRTATEVEVKKTTATKHHTARKAAHAPQEQPWHSAWPWIAAPVTMLTVGSATFLVVRRWLNNNKHARRSR